MKLSWIFGILFVVCLLAYLTIWGLVLSNPAVAVGLSFLLMPFGWGAGIFFVLAIVMFVLRR